MKRIGFVVTLLWGVLQVISAMASEESKTWPASDKEKKFVEETIVIGFFASP